jgi:hypothetical protein
MDGLMSHIRCMYHPRNTFKGGARIVEDSPGWLGMVSHVSHLHVPPKEHIYTKGGPG